MTRTVPPATGAALLLAAGLVETFTTGTTGTHPSGTTLPFTLLLCLCSTLPTALTGTRPAAAALTVTPACVLSLAPFHTLTIAGLLAQLWVLHRLGECGMRRLAALLVAPFVVVAPIVCAGGAHAGTRVTAALIAALAPAAAWAGSARRESDQARIHDAARRVAADTSLAYAARGERARIARELHDVVAHHVSLIAVQAETARLATPGMPAEGAQRLHAIGDTARAALTEMRRLLGVLRDDTGETPPERAPQPGLAELIRLVDDARDTAGITARLIVSGTVVPLDPGVELTAYRIVQEALTNSRRHAPGSAVDVELTYAPGTLGIRIRDNGPGPHHDADGDGDGGHGLIGMHERAATVGGTLTAGAAPGGGFAVRATLPAALEAHA